MSGTKKRFDPLFDVEPTKTEITANYLDNKKYHKVTVGSFHKGEKFEALVNIEDRVCIPIRD